MKEVLIKELQSIEEFFTRSSSCLQESNADFRPAEGALSVKEQVAHVAQSVDWFMHGMTSKNGFDMDFEKHWQEISNCTSLEAARKWFSSSIQKAIDKISNLSEKELFEPLPAGPVMGGAPRLAVVGGISDHTAHHRGALTVYSRLLGLEPKMPYMG